VTDLPLADPPAPDPSAATDPTPVPSRAGTRLDSLGMFDATFGLPEQVEEAGRLDLDSVPLPDGSDVGSVVLLGMGGSGIGGDLVAAVSGPLSPVPVLVTKGYDVPAFVDRRTLVVALSFSGNTEETISAATQAHEAGARVLVICEGGRLAELGAEWDVPVIRLPGGIPMPRAGIGALGIPPLLVLDRLGFLPGAGAQIASAVDQLKRRRDALLLPNSAATALARRIGRTLPVVYAGGNLGAVAASRWKGQINENAKVPAFANVLPELCHNEICGWGQHGDVTRQVFTQILLRHDFEHPGTSRRFELIEPLVDEVVSATLTVRAEGDGPLAQLLDLVLTGDVTSLELAAQEGLDPGPVPVLDQIKQALAGG